MNKKYHPKDCATSEALKKGTIIGYLVADLNQCSSEYMIHNDI